MDGLPQHIAIIMDGNGRWAKKQGLARIQGHQQGVESVREIVRAAGEIGIKYMTLYAFSTENWARPKEEIDFLMGLLSRYLERELNELTQRNVRLSIIGRIQDLPKEIQKKLRKTIEETKDNKGLSLTLALSYSSRVEIADACREIAEKVKRGELETDAICPETIDAHLYTKGTPDPDLLIRTSGEMRLSNFLMWQLSYTEVYVTDVLWPDFRKEELAKAIAVYAKRERRFGRTEATATRNG